MRPPLTLHAVVFGVVEAEVVSQLPAHHQLLDEGGHGLGVLPAALHLQRHTLSRYVSCSEEGDEGTQGEDMQVIKNDPTSCFKPHVVFSEVRGFISPLQESLDIFS